MTLVLLGLAGVQECGRDVDQVTRPDQVVHVVAVAAGLAPGRAGRGDEGPGAALVLEAAEDGEAGAGELTAVPADLDQVGRQVGLAAPAPLEGVAGLARALAQRHASHLLGVRGAVAEADGELEGAGRSRQLRPQRNVARTRPLVGLGHGAVRVVEVHI